MGMGEMILRLFLQENRTEAAAGLIDHSIKGRDFLSNWKDLLYPHSPFFNKLSKKGQILALYTYISTMGRQSKPLLILTYFLLDVYLHVF